MKTICFTDLDKQLLLELAYKFGDTPKYNFEFKHNAFFSNEAEAFVSPANSLGIMAGGLDGVIVSNYVDIDKHLQSLMKERGLEEVAVGDSLVLDISDKYPTHFKSMIMLPTMEMQGMDISDTDNVKRAFKALLQTLDEHDIKSVNISGLGTGVGGVTAEDCAHQMFEAFMEHSKGI